MAQTFGTVQLPPPSLLPAAVAKAVEAFGEARRASGKAQAELGNHRRVVLPQARQRDIEASADAIESGAKDPGPKFERQAQDKLADLERAAEAADLVARRSGVRMHETIEKHHDQIREDAEQRLVAARAAYVQALDALESATADLTEAQALVAWAADGASFKVRGGPRARVVMHSDEPVPVSDLVPAMRQAIEPPGPRQLPSPFNVAVVPGQEAAAVEPPVPAA